MHSFLALCWFRIQLGLFVLYELTFVQNLHIGVMHVLLNLDVHRRKDEVQGLMDKILYQRALSSMEQTVHLNETMKHAPQPPTYPDKVSSSMGIVFNVVWLRDEIFQKVNELGMILKTTGMLISKYLRNGIFHYL